jgi:hypothetical protein
LAEEAPICQGRLRGEFGYNAATPDGDAVLDGSYETTSDLHLGTKLLFDSIARIGRHIPPDSVNQLINRRDWQ